MIMKKKLYISIEGGDGSGKTTLIKNLMVELTKNLQVLLTKEFGSEHNHLCQELRKIALSSTFETDEVAGQILFGAIIKQHMEKVIKPCLEDHHTDIILSDRGRDSNYAYGPAHGVNAKVIKKFFDLVYLDCPKPDLTIYLDVNPELAKARRDSRPAEKFDNNGVDRVEQKGIDLQIKVRKNFLSLAKKEPKRIKVIKVTEEKKPEDIFAEALNLVNKKMKEKRIL